MLKQDIMKDVSTVREQFIVPTIGQTPLPSSSNGGDHITTPVISTTDTNTNIGTDSYKNNANDTSDESFERIFTEILKSLGRKVGTKVRAYFCKAILIF
jgi:hypothetical protein